MSYKIQRGAIRSSLDIVGRRPALTVALEGVIHTVEEASNSDSAFELRIDGHLFRGRRSVTDTEIQIRLAGQTFVFQRVEGVRQADSVSGTGDGIRAGMPGTVIACHVEPGMPVEIGVRLVTIESMKLQMTISAPRAGIVAAIHVAENATFERNALLVSLEPLTPEA